MTRFEKIISDKKILAKVLSYAYGCNACPAGDKCYAKNGICLKKADCEAMLCEYLDEEIVGE